MRIVLIIIKLQFNFFKNQIKNFKWHFKNVKWQLDFFEKDLKNLQNVFKK